MKKSFCHKLFPILVFIYSLLVALFWTALRINFAGISKFLGADTNQSFFILYLPVMICILLWILCGYSLFAYLRYDESHTMSAISLVLSVVFTIGICVVIYFGAVDYLSFILLHFIKSIAACLLILLVAIPLLFPWKSIKKRDTVIKAAVVVGFIIATVVIGYRIRFNGFSCDAVVYAVEDEYQIVFTTRDNSIAWIEVDGVEYYDLYAGSMRSKDLVHKVCVPQNILDSAGSYTIYAQQMIYRGPFGGFKGKTISKYHDFYSVDSSDGIKYYALADVHGNFDAAVNAATKQGKLDFIVILGDSISMVERAQDANATSLLASAITGGSIPVVYARGNHEIKGECAEDLYKYVGANNEKYYYTFSLSNIKGIVLDMGEDHDDDWWEYYGTSKFDTYRDEQTVMLQKCIENNYFSDCEYRMVLCHIPISFVNSRNNHVKYKTEWTELINNLNIDIMLNGHEHDLSIFVPGEIKPNEKLTYNSFYTGIDNKTYDGFVTEYNFYSFLVARSSYDQLSSEKSQGKEAFTGLCVEANISKATQKAYYTNSVGDKVKVCSMFGTDKPTEEYEFPISNTY